MCWASSENDEREFIRAVLINIAAQDRVRGDEQIKVLSLCPFVGAIRTGQIEGAQVGRESLRFAQPILDQARRAHDQGSPILRSRTKKCAKRQRLQRLAESHVVGQQSREILLGETREPFDALSLIRSKLRPQCGIERAFDIRRR